LKNLLNYREHGSGRPVIILHGLLGSLENWQAIAVEIARYYKVFTLDLRNHGKSFHSGRINYPIMAEDLLSFIKYQKLQSVSIIGHSMGGKVAMQFAFSYPVHLKDLIVVDIVNRNYPPHWENIIEALWQLDISSLSSLNDADEMLRPHISDIKLRLFLLKNLERTSKGLYRWRINLEAIRRSYGTLCRKVEEKHYGKSCLFVRGEDSDYIQDTDWPENLKSFPKAYLITIPDAGHWLHIEAKEIFIRTVCKYLRS